MSKKITTHHYLWKNPSRKLWRSFFNHPLSFHLTHIVLKYWATHFSIENYVVNPILTAASCIVPPTCWISTVSSSSRRADWCWTSGCSCGPLPVWSGGQSLVGWWSASCQTGWGTSQRAWRSRRNLRLTLKILEKFEEEENLSQQKDVTESKNYVVEKINFICKIVIKKSILVYQSKKAVNLVKEDATMKLNCKNTMYQDWTN